MNLLSGNCCAIGSPHRASGVLEFALDRVVEGLREAAAISQGTGLVVPTKDGATSRLADLPALVGLPGG